MFVCHSFINIVAASTDMQNSHRFYIETYGCQMNVADTEVVLSIMAKSGYVRAVDPAEADVILVNTLQTLSLLSVKGHFIDK